MPSIFSLEGKKLGSALPCLSFLAWEFVSLAKLPCWQLRCRPDEEAVKVCKAAIEG